MDNKNLINNLTIKQMIDSNAMGHNADYLSSNPNYNFRILERAYANTSKEYAALKIAVENNNCTSDNCLLEIARIKQLEEAPQKSIDFISTVLSEVSTVEEYNFDPNNNYEYTVVFCILSSKPGFSMTDGYNVSMYLLGDGGQDLVFEGPAFEEPLLLNSNSITALLESGTSIVASTPDITKGMMKLLAEIGVFLPEDINENNELKATAKISEEFILKDKDGQPIYEVIEIGDGMGRNVLQYDLQKIQTKADPFIKSEISGIMSLEQQTIAAWNVYLAQLTSDEEDDQMVQNANAGSLSWDYQRDLPLHQDKKIIFGERYKQFFIKNYLVQFLTNKLPYVEEDAAVFDLQQGIAEKAQKIMGNQ